VTDTANWSADEANKVNRPSSSRQDNPSRTSGENKADGEHRLSIGLQANETMVSNVYEHNNVGKQDETNRPTSAKKDTRLFTDATENIISRPGSSRDKPQDPPDGRQSVSGTGSVTNGQDVSSREGQRIHSVDEEPISINVVAVAEITDQNDGNELTKE